jgi:hypothetical protein
MSSASWSRSCRRSLADDPDRSRMAIKRIVGAAIQVEADEREVRFYAEKQAFEVSMLRAMGAGNGLHVKSQI